MEIFIVEKHTDGKVEITYDIHICSKLNFVNLQVLARKKKKHQITKYCIFLKNFFKI